MKKASVLALILTSGMANAQVDPKVFAVDGPTPFPIPAPNPPPAPPESPKPIEPPGEPKTPETNPESPVPHESGRIEVVGDYQSWSEHWSAKAADHQLAQLPSNLDTVLISFARPETSYQAGQKTWVGTGLDFISDFGTIRNAITIMKMKNPKAKFLLSVGGLTYVKWDKAKPLAIADLVQDLGLDGANLDYEPLAKRDQEFIQLVKDFRAVLPRPLLLTSTASSVVLYKIPLSEVGGSFDSLFLTDEAAYQAFREIYKGSIYLVSKVPQS